MLNVCRVTANKKISQCLFVVLCYGNAILNVICLIGFGKYVFKGKVRGAMRPKNVSLKNTIFGAQNNLKKDFHFVYYYFNVKQYCTVCAIV